MTVPPWAYLASACVLLCLALLVPSPLSIFATLIGLALAGYGLLG